jgi:HK97 family phage prohead protease
MKENKLWPENKTVLCQIKAADENSGKGVFEGYANVFNYIDFDDDIVEQGAFKKTLQEITDKKRALFFMHQSYSLDSLLGEATELEENAKGLFVKGEIDLNFESGRKAWAFIKRGTIDRMSIGYQVLLQEFIDHGKRLIRHIKEARLFEISLTPIGMAANDRSTIDTIKSISDIYAFIRSNLGNKDMMEKILSLYGVAPPSPELTQIKAPGTNGDTGNHLAEPGGKGFHQQLLELIGG